MYAENFTGGVGGGFADVNGNGRDDLVTGDGSDGGGFPDQPVTDGVDSPQHTVALSSGGGGDDEGDQAPKVAEERSADEVGGIDEIDLAPTRDGLVRQGFQGTIPKLVLGLQVDVGGNAPGLAVLQAQALLKKAAPA